MLDERRGDRGDAGTVSIVALVEAFYRQLRDPGVSKAVALQRAQLSLLEDRRYRHPAYWAPYLLINNW